MDKRILIALPCAVGFVALAILTAPYAANDQGTNEQARAAQENAAWRVAATTGLFVGLGVLFAGGILIALMPRPKRGDDEGKGANEEGAPRRGPRP